MSESMKNNIKTRLINMYPELSSSDIDNLSSLQSNNIELVGSEHPYDEEVMGHALPK